MSQHDAADLGWLAFQYVSDELSADEVVQFEAHLAGDQAAREAVAEAVLLCQAVAAGEEIVPVAAERRSWAQHAVWAAIGAAACLAIVFALREPIGKVQNSAARRPGAVDLTSAELALVWAQNLELPDAASSDEEDLGLAVDVRESDRDVLVPAWMLEALGGSQEVSPVVPESKES